MYLKSKLWDTLGPVLIGAAFFIGLPLIRLGCNGNLHDIAKTPTKKESKRCEMVKSENVDVKDTDDNNTRLILERDTYTSQSTIGNLYLDKNNNGYIDKKDEPLGRTLELPWKENQ